MLGFENSCRVVFGESDGLPGLTVDKFADCLSFQIVSRGMERWKDDIVAILTELFQPQGIYERDDVAVREKEGLPQIKECVYGTVPEEIEIREHDVLIAGIDNLVSLSAEEMPFLTSSEAPELWSQLHSVISPSETFFPQLSDTRLCFSFNTVL